MGTEGLKGALLSILVIALIASTISLLSLSLAFAEPGQSPPLSGGNLVIVQSVDANTLDVHRTRFELAYQAITLVHDTLMTFDYDMQYIPLLAESWEVDPDGLYIDFHLREDVKFHCGEPFNADAVVYTIRRVKEPWSAHADSVKNVLDAEKLDEYTVRIHLKQWDRWLYDWFATTSSSIVCPHCGEEHGLDYGEKYFCGTGPFKVKEWIREDRLILERNEDYRWGPEIYQNRGPAHIAGVTFEVIPTDISREDKFKKGEADMMIGFSPRPALVEWLNTTENVIFIINASSSMSYVGFHVGTLSPEILQGIVSGRPYPPSAIRSPVSDDPEGKGLLVRKALLYATHRENLILYAWDGMGKVAYGPLTSMIWGYNPAMEDMYPYDPEMARSLLAQAGYAGGLELTVITTNYEPYTKTAQVLKEQWAKVGVTLNIEVRVFDDMEGIIANAQHDLWVGGWTWHNADMIWWYWHTVRVPPASNRFWWGSAYTDALIDNTFDIDDDVSYYAIQESQRLIMEDAAYLPVVERPFLLAHWDRVKGFKMHPLSNLVWKHLDTCIGLSHGPILIVGNDDFTPANGVVAGFGTENDPYIIEDWDISAENANGIEIRNTTAHFIIRNCYVHDGRKEFMTGYVGIALYNVTNGKIDNNLLKNNLAGILLDNSDSSLVSNNLVENSWGGVVLLDSSNNRISNNIARNNRSDGIFLGGDNNLVSNNVVGNQIDGIHIIGEGNLVSNNVAENNYDGILLFGSGNNLSSNIMKNNINGIELMIGNNNLISNNLVENNDYGIFLPFPAPRDNNRIYHNNLINNTNQAYDDGSNYWDNGYPSGGNYWSDYAGVDENRGENQDIPGSDGIGDTPYYIPGDNNRDRYPLMRPWGERVGLANTPWPKFKHDAQNTGRSSAPSISQPMLKWSYMASGEIHSSPAIASDGTVYVGSHDGNLYALNPDGTLKWSYATGDYIYSSPAIASDGTVYFGSRDKNLYALNPNGTLKWSYTTGSVIYNSSPAIASDGTVYVGSLDRKLYALNPDGTLKWSYATGDYIYSSPAIASDGTVYFGSVDRKLYVLNPDGTLKWSYATGGSVFSSPAIASDGTVYVGSNDYKLYSLKPDGSLKWSSTIGHQVISSPAIALDGTIYVGQQDSWLYALNPDGTVKWRYLTGGSVRSSPAIASDGTVYVGSLGRKLYAFNPDGTLKWSYATGGEIDSSPAIAADGTVYIGSYDYKLYAIEEMILTPRSPIYINGNAGFTPANGVTSGSGTVDDPYIIEGWAIDASSADGIRIQNTTKYFVVRNCLVENGGKSYRGIYLDTVVNGKVENNTCENNSWSGIHLWHSSNNTLSNNTCKNNGYGIYLGYSSNNTLRNNLMENNTCNFSVYGLSLSDFLQDIDTSNLVDGKPVRYLIDNHDEVIGPSLSIGYLALVRCDNVRVENLVLKNNYDGILLAFTENSWVENCVYSNNYVYGINLWASSNNIVQNNTCENNSYGIYLCVSSSNNTLTNNTCENNKWEGIRLSYSSNNTIFHNNFINNGTQAYDASSNYWDDGYPSGGNYWSDYTGVDNYQGENQDIPGSDGIGDVPYYIPGDNNHDRYPLMSPWLPIIRGVEVSISPDYQENLPGGTLSYTVTITNTGNVADNYNLTASDNAGWRPMLDDNVLEVPASENRQTTLGVIIPENAVPSTEDNITVTATSQADNTVSDNDSCIACVQVVWIRWIRQFGTSDWDSARTVAVDTSGNVYVAGQTLGALPGQTSSGGYDVFVRKYDGSGNELWTRQFGSSTGDGASDVAVDGSGNVYIAGYTHGSLPGQTSSGGPDVYVRKYDADGNELWTRQFGTSTSDYLAGGIAVDTLGNVYVAGQTLGEFPGQSSSGSWDAFVRKYDASGNELWTRQFGSSDFDSAFGIAVDTLGNVYVAGQTNGGLPGQIFLGYQDAFVRKYDASGNELWTRQFGSSAWDTAYGVVVDNWGNVYVTGGMPGGAFLRKYDGAGSELWTRQFGTWDYDYAYGVAVDTLGNVYVAGETLDALPGQSSSGGWDAYVRKYDGAGSELWTRQFGTSDHDYASGVVVDTLGNVYIAGYTHGSLPGQSSSGGVDAFLVKFVQPSPPPPPGIEWDASITATFSGGSDDAVFGVRPDATPGFDSAYDIPEPPPPVEPPYLRTFFYYPVQTPDELHRSCLAPENLMEWPLRIEYADNMENVTLTWSVENVPPEYNVLLYRGEDLVADMRAEENYTIEATAGSYDFRIVVGKLLPFTLELTHGWNMISFPVLPENTSPDAIFGSYYVMYGWDAENKRYVLHADSGGFIEPDLDVEVGVGYWAYVLEDENVNLLGVPVNQLTLNLRQGWNLIGPPYGGSSIADLADDPDNSVIPWAFTWNAHEKSYGMTQLLEAGKGYWVYALQPPQPPYPAISATSAKYGDNEIRINVLTGSIPWGEWAYSVSSTEGSYSWITGTEELDPPYVSLGTYASGTYYVSLKHIDSGHFYFNDQPLTIS